MYPNKKILDFFVYAYRVCVINKNYVFSVSNAFEIAKIVENKRPNHIKNKKRDNELK